MSRVKICCVYKIENIENGKFYIGGTTNYFHRRSQHLYNLRISSYANTPLQEDFLQFGEHFFVFSVLKRSTPETIEQDEQFWIDKLHPAYNMSRFSKRPDDLIVFSEKANLSRSETVRKLWENPEYHSSHCKPRNWKNGIPNRRGVKLSDETREKIRQANLGSNNPNYGKPRQKSFIDKVAHTYSGVIDPEGKVYAPIINMSAFCREHRLDNGQMTRLMQGKVVKYKGWVKFTE